MKATEHRMKIGELRIINVPQGTPEWHKIRRSVDLTASEGPALMGCDPRNTRTDLLNRRKFGLEDEIDDYRQRFLFDPGHEAEAKARPLVEVEEMLDLPPAVGIREIDGVTILASLDGWDGPTKSIWEHKWWNQLLAEAAGNADLPPEKWWQSEAQILVFGADRVLFTVSDGTEENMVTTEYRAHPGRAEQLIEAVKQFKRDMAEHAPPAADVIPEGVAPKQLPALQIAITGSVTQSNLRQFRLEANNVVDAINTDLQTDQDFADAEATVKYCAEVEKKITAALDYMMAQAVDVDQARREVEDIREMFRLKRLSLDRLVKTQKQTIRAEMINRARIALEKHIDELNASMLRPYIPTAVDADFVGALKGKRYLSTAQAAVDQELADAKLRANEVAKRVAYNLKTFLDKCGDRESLFPDLRDLVQGDPVSFDAVVEQRIKNAEEERVAREEARDFEAKTAREKESTTQRQIQMPPALKTQEEPPPSPFSAENAPPDDVIVSVVAESFGVDQDIVSGWLISLVERLRPDLKQPVNDVDDRGVPWIPEAHSAQKTKTKSGAWRARKGVGKDRIAELEKPYLGGEAVPF